MYCIGIAKSTGERCRLKAESNRDYCKWHGPQCQAIAQSTNQRCRKRAKQEFDWKYCCTKHDPRSVTSTDTSVFRMEGLRKSKGKQVLEFRKYRDAYQNKPIGQDPMWRKCYQLDHIVEIHQVRDAYDSVKKHGIGFRQRQTALRDILKETVNMMENLNLTTTGINQTKFRAVADFQEDYKLHPELAADNGLFYYLDRANSGTTRLTRDVSRRIQKEMLSSKDKLLDALQDEDDLQGQVIEHLQKTSVAMRLY